ncbi:hypothetical protein AB1J28_20265 [Lysinibacillus irui]|uniref:hypothetical protein n=1 Tax=Lysinibacillus TaxID=400634 RepID=UPI001967E30A|nr:hypothetical protein [Lysinibacillus fusiformis]QSB12054.1 hypothetical protein JTI58_10805 [Lysinibacillus fusiformis]
MSNTIIQSKMKPIENLVCEFENTIVELQALLVDATPMLKAIKDINELYESELDAEDIQRLRMMQFRLTFDHSHNAAHILNELGRITAEGSALLYVLDNQTA